MVIKPIGKILAGCTLVLVCLALLSGLVSSDAVLAYPVTCIRPDIGTLRWRYDVWAARQAWTRATTELHMPTGERGWRRCYTCDRLASKHYNRRGKRHNT